MKIPLFTLWPISLTSNSKPTININTINAMFAMTEKMPKDVGGKMVSR